MAHEVFYFMFFSFFMILFAGAYGILFTLGNSLRLPFLKFVTYLLGLLEVLCSIFLFRAQIISLPWKLLILACGFGYFFLPIGVIHFVKKFPLTKG